MAPASPARRADLDGLRALAVLLVAVYHVWFHRVSGGVDVFLALSGFFVGTSVVSAVVDGRFRTVPYLHRLMRRLLPALITVIAGVFIAAAILLPVSDWAEVARQGLASVLYAENWYLATAGQAYGAASVVESPFQHIWSLSVQGQFFVLLPIVAGLLALLARRLRRGSVWRIVVFGLAAATVASFAWAWNGIVVNQEWTYFDSAARAWEFLAGAMLGLWLASARSDGFRRWRDGHPVTTAVLSWTGLAAILATGIVTNGFTQFPGPATLLPVGGALLIVAFFTPRWGTSRILGLGPVATAGAYAYAFYLWHWPVLVFAAVVLGSGDLGIAQGMAVLLLSAGLAVATTLLVERPFRPRAIPSLRLSAMGLRVVAGFVATTVVLLPATWIARVELERGSLSVSQESLDTHPGALAVVHPDLFEWEESAGVIPSFAIASEDKPKPVEDGCASVEHEVVICSYGDLDADRVVAVVGGSHAEQWVDALALIGEENGFRVDTMIKWSCALIEGTRGVESMDAANHGCDDWSENALRTLERRAPDAVFTTLTRPSEEVAGPNEVIPVAYERAFRALARASIPTIAIRDNPWTGEDTVGCVEQFGPTDTRCRVRASTVLDDEAPVARMGAYDGSLRVLDMNDVICPDGWCSFAQGGRLVYRDAHHLSNSYVLSLTPILKERVLPLLVW